MGRPVLRVKCRWVSSPPTTAALSRPPVRQPAAAQTTIPVMSRVLPLSEVKATLSEVVDAVVTNHERVTVTRNGSPVAVVLSTADLESIEETIAILSDPSAVEAIELGRAAVANGDVATLDEMEALREQLRRSTA